MTDNNKRDWFKIFDVSANVLGTIGTIAIAAIGFWFTSSYNQSQQELDRNEALTSLITFLDETETSEPQRKTAYNILLRLGYERDFRNLAVEYPNRLATQKLIELAAEKKETRKQKQTQESHQENIISFEDIQITLDDFITKYSESLKRNETGEKQDRLRDSVFAIEAQEVYPELAHKADALLSEPVVKPESEEKLGDLWAVIFGSYRSEEIPEEDIKKLKATLGKESLGIRVYQRDGKYRLVSVYRDQATARNALDKAQKKRPSSYLRNLEDWCNQKKCTPIPPKRDDANN
ncbi:SPOR domain-containing protein [Microcystis aeruginosa CS-563/04]|uniref:SPOR domain-containing protein n=1 Tax=Microcystis aeruginosa TaxID=1126 RepID=UPI00232F3F26|nr:SPOR domain-containing protein [Microcystis aeruginosa]MDB9420994.1 SPOR domain-containing protein [Microcystis aeruginosa CS-563/04]